MTNSFVFFDNFSIDPRSRREIRSHVMRGKNTSKARAQKQRRVPTDQEPKVKLGDAERQEEESVEQKMPMEIILHNTQGSLTPTVLIPNAFRRLEDSFSGIKFAITMDDHLQLLVKQFCMSYGRYIYPAEFCYQQNLIDLPWFDFLMLDEAYCYGFLAISIAFWDFARGRKTQSLEYKRYFSRCVGALNKKLSGPGATETSTIALVTGLCVLCGTLGEHASLKIHVDGLRNIIKHRGGIRTLLDDHPVVMEKVQRADIEDALATGCPATFPKEVVDDERRVPLPDLEVEEFPFFDTINAVHSGLANAAQEVQVLTRYLAAVADGPGKLPPTTFASHVTHSFSRVLAQGSIGTSAFTDPVADLVHLTLSAILSVLTVQFGMPNPSRYDILIARLKWVVEGIMAAGSALPAVIDPLLMNWVLHVLPATVFTESDNHWLITKMLLVRHLLGFETWQEAHASVHAFPWVADFHDKHIARLWSHGRNTPASDGGLSSEDASTPERPWCSPFPER